MKRLAVIAFILTLLPGAVALGAAAASPSPSVEITNTSKCEVYATLWPKPGAPTMHLYLPVKGREKVYETGPYVLKGYAIINGLKVDLPNLSLSLNPSLPLSVIISDSGKMVVWASRPGGTSSAPWY